MLSERRKVQAAGDPRQRADRIRRILLASTLVLAPVLLAISSFMAPSVDWSSKQDIVAKATAQPGLWQAYNVVALFGFMLLIPAIIAAVELIRHRFARMALAIVILVSVSSMLIAGAIFSETLLAGAKGVSGTAMTQYLTQVDDLGVMAVLIPLFFASFIGYLLLAFGLWRSKATAPWIPALFGASFVVLFFTEQDVVSGIASLGMATASAGIAQAFLTGNEEPAPAIIPKGIDAAA